MIIIINGDSNHNYNDDDNSNNGNNIIQNKLITFLLYHLVEDPRLFMDLHSFKMVDAPPLKPRALCGYTISRKVTRQRM